MSEQQTQRTDGPSFEAVVRALRILRSYYRESVRDSGACLPDRQRQDVPASVEIEPGSVLAHMHVAADPPVAIAFDS